MPKLDDLLREKKAVLTDKWIEKTLETYPAESRAFFRRQKNRFANPVGQALAAGLEAAFEALLTKADSAVLCGCIEEIVKVRAVQDFTPSRAVVFALLLKDVIREEIQAQLDRPQVAREFLDFERRIDQMALFAFDLFVRSREKMYQLRVNEVERRISSLVKRSGFFIDNSGSEPQPEKDAT
ncbi:MAG TPA: RsbRD N-terminal domain-containing protein [Myxococcota bacterium]|nr:RsbRD N-terminal domain-containing protein [Myxococcota bacterium]